MIGGQVDSMFEERERLYKRIEELNSTTYRLVDDLNVFRRVVKRLMQEQGDLQEFLVDPNDEIRRITRAVLYERRNKK